MASLFDLFVSVSGDNSGFKRAMKDSQADLSGFEKSALSATSRVSDAFASLGLKLSAAGVGAFILKAGKDFQDAGAQIAKTTGKVGSDLAGLQESFKRLYATSGRGGDEIASGLSKIAVETRLTGKELEALTAANLKFAKVTQSELVGSVEATQTVFKQFNIVASEQADKLEVLYAVYTATGVKVETLASEMAAVGPTARAFGLSFNDTAALVGKFYEAGLRASDVTRGLNTLFAKFSAAGKDPKQALVELFDKLKNASTATAAFNELIEAGFAKRAAVAMQDAARRGALQFEGLADQAGKSKGKIDDVAEAAQTFGERWTKLQHTLEVAVLPGGNFIVKWANDAIDKMNLAYAVINSLGPAIWRTMTGQDAPLPFSIGYSESRSAHRGANSGTSGGADTGASAGAWAETLKKDFSTLGLTDLNQKLADSIKAFHELADSGKLTHDQMIQAAEAIQKLRNQLKPAFVGPASPEFLAGVGAQANKGVDWMGGDARQVTMDQLRDLPMKADVFNLPELSAVTRTLDMITGAINEQAQAVAVDARNAQYVTDAFHTFGLQTPGELDAVAKEAEDAYSTMRGSGVASASAIQIAWQRMFKAQIDAQLAAGKITKKEYDDLAKEADVTFGKLSKDSTKTIAGLSDGIAKGLGGVLRDLISHTKTVGQAFKAMGMGIADTLLNVVEHAFAKMLTTWITNLIVGKATASAADAGQVTGQAGIAGAAGFASVMASIPFPFNVALAPEVAAASTAAVLGSFLPMALFAKGGEVYDDTPGFFNKKEMVLPEDIAVPLKRMVRGGSVGGGGSMFRGCTFHGVTRETVKVLGNMLIRQARLAGAEV